MLTLKFRCARIERHTVPMLGRLGNDRPEERRTISLVPSPTRDPLSGNRSLWTRGLAAGELVIAEIEPEIAEKLFELHRDYVLEIHAADEDPTKP